MSEGGDSRTPIPAPRALRAWGAMACALVLAIQVRSVFSRAIGNDDYQLLYTASLRSAGKVPAVDFGAFSPQPLADLMAPVAGAFHDSLGALYVARGFVCVLHVMIAAAVYRVAQRAFGGRGAVVAAVLALASQALLHRGLDLRPDIVTTVLWLVAFVVALAPSRHDVRRVAFALGVVVALAFVNRFKAVIVAPFAFAVLAGERDRRDWLRGLVPAAVGAALVIAIYVASLAATGQLAAHREILGQLGKAIQGTTVAASVRAATLRALITRDPLLCAVAALGVLSLVSPWASARARRVGVAIALLAGVSVAGNLAYYAYNLVTLAPLLALLAGACVEHLLPRASIAATLVAVQLGIAAPVLWRVVTLDALAPQRALHTFLWRTVAPHEPIFALEGIGLYRPSTFHFRMPEVLRAHYEAGAFDLAREMAMTKPVVVLQSYRVPGWLVTRDRSFIEARYVPLVNDVLVPGAHVRGATSHTLDVMRDATFEMTRHGGGPCTVDGLPFDAPRTLPAGPHLLTGAPDTECTVRRVFDHAAVEALAAAPRGPHLLSPRLETP